jgi:hypothetical protein
MPLNSALDVKRFDKYLTNFSLDLLQSESVFKAHNIASNVPVQQQSNFYRIYDQGAFVKPQMKPLADGAQTSAMEYDFTEGTYAAKVWGVHKDTGPMAYANADSDLNLDRRTTSALLRQGLLHQEVEWHKAFFGTGKWSTDKQGVASVTGGNEFLQFSDASSDPIGVVKSAITQNQILSGGFRVNTGVMSRVVFDTLVEHPDMVDRINRGQTTGPAIANEQTLAAIFGLDRIVVLDAVVEESGANAMLGGKGILLAHIDGNAGIEGVTSMARFEWVGLNQQMTIGQSILRYELPLVDGGTRLEIKQAFDYRIVAPDLGVFLADAIA